MDPGLRRDDYMGRPSTSSIEPGIDAASDAFLYQMPRGQLVLEVGVVDRRGDDAGNAEGGVHHQHGDQELPGARLDAVADDAGVDEIFQLVDEDQEQERAER